MSPTDKPSDAENPLDRGAPGGGTEEEVVQGEKGEIPVQGDEETADDLAKKAFGDKDGDGEGDVPHVPFPG